jgi:DNA-binding XRE family transcriptional regulator
MKEKDVYVEFKPHQLVLYVEKDDDSYGPVQTGSFMAKNYLDDYFEKFEKWEKSLREQLKKGEISPVYYYMILQSFGEGDLASRVGVSKRKLKQHFKMEYFEKLKLSQIKKYADAFDIPVASLFQLMMSKHDEKEKISIKQMETQNPYFVISKVEMA